MMHHKGKYFAAMIWRWRAMDEALRRFVCKDISFPWACISILRCAITRRWSKRQDRELGQQIFVRLWQFSLDQMSLSCLLSKFWCHSRYSRKQVLFGRTTLWYRGIAMRPRRVLNVAEKNDAAKELSRIMSRGQCLRVGRASQIC